MKPVHRQWVMTSFYMQYLIMSVKCEVTELTGEDAPFVPNLWKASLMHIVMAQPTFPSKALVSVFVGYEYLKKKYFGDMSDPGLFWKDFDKKEMLLGKTISPPHHLMGCIGIHIQEKGLIPWAHKIQFPEEDPMHPKTKLKVAVIENFMVTEDYRGVGTGVSLIDGAENLARQRHCIVMEHTTFAYSGAKLLKKKGFNVQAEKSFYGFLTTYSGYKFL